ASWTGTCPVSAVGSSSRAVSPVRASTGEPHCGQKRLFFGSLEPQTAQLAGGMNGVVRLRAGLALQGTQSLDRAPAQRPHQFAVILVRDLPGAVVELELLQGRQGSVAFLCQLDALLLGA